MSFHGEREYGTTLVRIEIKSGTHGRIYATSEDLKGFLVSKATQAEVLDAIPLAIRDLYKACGMDVIVDRVVNKIHPDDGIAFAAIPADIRQRAGI